MDEMRDSVLNEIQALGKSKDPKQAEDFLCSLIKLLHSSAFQHEIFKSFENWMKIFSIFTDQLLLNFPKIFPKLETFYIQNLTSSSLILRNFLLFLLLDLCQKIPIARCQQICEYLISLGESQSNEQVLRFLSSPVAAFYSVQYLFRNGNFDLARQVVFFLQPDEEIFAFAKSQMGINASMHLHYLLAKSGEGENLAGYFKSCASRVWAAGSHSKKTKIEVLALLQYCLCKFIQNETSNIEIIKSIIVSLTVISDYLEQFNDPEVALMASCLLESFDSIQFLDQHQRKLKELLEKIRFKLPSEVNKANWPGTNEDIVSFLDSCKIEIDIQQPLSEIKERLGLPNPVQNNLDGAIAAVSEILNHLTYLKNLNN